MYCKSQFRGLTIGLMQALILGPKLLLNPPDKNPNEAFGSLDCPQLSVRDCRRKIVTFTG